jgi:hypothetical protein
MPEADLPDVIKLVCMPDSAEPAIYIASRETVHQGTLRDREL